MDEGDLALSWAPCAVDEEGVWIAVGLAKIVGTCRRKVARQKPAASMSFRGLGADRGQARERLFVGECGPQQRAQGHRRVALVPKDVGGSRLTGELKLRFHLKRAHLLEGLDEACRQELIAHPAAYIRVLNRHTSYEPAAW